MTKCDTTNSICDFRGEYAFLSNFYEAPVVFEGIVFRSSEALYQAMKCKTNEERMRFSNYSSREAKYYGKMIDIRSDWNDIKLGIMLIIVRAKFNQNKHLANKLLNTGDKELIEGNTWGDTYWGVDVRKNKGDNMLGKILMQVRDEIRRAL